MHTDALYGNQALAVVALAAALNSRCLAPGRAADHLDDEHDHESEQQEGDECGQESASTSRDAASRP